MPTTATTSAEVDMYGQVRPNETPELISKSLKNLDAELEKLPTDDTKGWKQAKEKCPKLTDNDHKLMFLRCEVFDTDLAAIRLAAYWEKRIEIFGPEKAFLPLTLDGALKDDGVALSFGFARLVAGSKDPAGRGLLYVDPANQDKTQYTRDSMLRSLWYVVHAALEEEGAQKMGIVLIVNPSRAHFSQFDRTQAKMNVESKGCIPVRAAAFHICHPPKFFAIIFPIMKLFLGERMRKRIKVHTGSEGNVLKKLSKYGLTKDILPTDLGGQISLDHEGWLQDRRGNGL